MIVFLRIHRWPGTNFCRYFFQGHANHAGGLEFLSRRFAHVGPAFGHDVIDNGFEGGLLFVRVGDFRGLAENHHGAIIHRMMKGRTSQHQTVEQGDGDADW